MTRLAGRARIARLGCQPLEPSERGPEPAAGSHEADARPTSGRAPRTRSRRTLAASRAIPASVGASIGLAGTCGWTSASPIERATRAPKTRPSSSELLARRFAPWTPGAGHLARGPEPAHARPAVEVHEHAAHVVVRGGSDRDRLAARVEPVAAAGLVTRSGTARGTSSPTASRASSSGRRPAPSADQRARATTSRGSSSALGPASARTRRPRSSTSVAPAPRSASVTKRHRVGTHVERRRMELHELEVREARAGAPGEGQAVAARLGRVGGPREELADAAGREHHGGRPVQHERSACVAHDHARRSRPPSTSSSSATAPSKTAVPRRAGEPGSQRANHLRARGVPRVEHAGPRVCRLARQVELARAVAVEARTERHQLPEPLRARRS